jgi:hypothetical protein
MLKRIITVSHSGAIYFKANTEDGRIKMAVEAVFQTETNDDGGVTIMKYTGEDTQVVIPASINGKPVTAIGERVFEQKHLTSVVIPDCVKSIGNFAFYRNWLKDVVIGNGVTIIGDSAFDENQLKSVVIPSSVKTIGNRAFAINWLTSVVIPDGVTTIGNQAFSGNQLTNVVIPGSVKTIESGMFAANQLTSVTIPGSVKTIRDNAFSMNQLTSIVIPDSVTIIGYGAFRGNPLTSVTIPGSVKIIGDCAFFCNQLTSVVIPDSVTTIGSLAFEGDGQNILTITIGANVNLGEWGYVDGMETHFESFYNGQGKKAGKYVLENGKYYNAEEKRKNDRWITIGALLGLVPLVGGFVVGHWFIGIIIGIVTAFVGAFAFVARGWGILALALIGGGIALGIHLGHPFIAGIIGVIAGFVVWAVGGGSKS